MVIELLDETALLKRARIVSQILREHCNSTSEVLLLTCNASSICGALIRSIASPTATPHSAADSEITSSHREPFLSAMRWTNGMRNYDNTKERCRHM